MAINDYTLLFRSLEENSSTVDWAVKGIPVQISHVRVRESDSADSFSPPPLASSEGDHPQDQTRNKVIFIKASFYARLLFHNLSLYERASPAAAFGIQLPKDAHESQKFICFLH